MCRWKYVFCTDIFNINFQTSPYNLLSVCKLYDLYNWIVFFVATIKPRGVAIEENSKLSIPWAFSSCMSTINVCDKDSNCLYGDYYHYIDCFHDTVFVRDSQTMQIFHFLSRKERGLD